MAVGLSADTMMGSDSVVVCYNGPASGVVHRWNGDYVNLPMADPHLGITNAKVTASDGKITCSFTRAR